MTPIETITSLIESDRLDEALVAAESAIAADSTPSASLLFLKGKILWRLGRRGEATSTYAESAALDPDGPASRALEHARDIDSFFNPDMFNP